MRRYGNPKLSGLVCQAHFLCLFLSNSKDFEFFAPKKCLVGDNPPLSTPLTMGGSRWTLMTPIEVLNTHFSFPDYCIQLTLFDGLTTIDNQDVTLGKIFSWKKNFRLNNLEFLFDTYIVVQVQSTVMSTFCVVQIIHNHNSQMGNFIYLKR